MCGGHVFSFIQLPFVFRLDNLLHLHLRFLLIGTYSLHLSPLYLCSSLSLHILKASPLEYLAMLLWWRCINSAFFFWENPYFTIHFNLRLSLSAVNLVTLHSAVRLEHHRVEQNPSWDWGYCLSSGCWGGRVGAEDWSSWAWGLLQYGRWLSSGILVATLLVLSQKLPSSVSPQASLAHFAHTFAGVQGKCLQMKICALAL